MIKLKPELRGNPEFQSALVRMGFWIFGVSYVGLGAVTGYYQVDLDYYLALFSAYLVFFLAMLVSVLQRPAWEARRYVGLTLDITATSLAIFLTREAISPFYLIYIWSPSLLTCDPPFRRCAAPWELRLSTRVWSSSSASIRRFPPR
ncbi:MAG: hypothetical protein U9Q81_04470 [Pseudomonadota bacterium]|nr:hypothetical protein [Pseudomonadota bacterium]